MWWRESLPPWLLRQASRAYSSINQRNLDRRSTRMRPSPLPLISIGNITAGGSGKTPFTIWLAQSLSARGLRPVILCRGDGGELQMPQWINQSSHTDDVGDEAILLQRLSNCPVLAASDRVLGCNMIADAVDVQADVVLLDDGFQYRHLGRCCDIVLVPAEGIGNGWMIPAGPLREPVVALDRADFIVRSSHQAAVRHEPLHSGKEWKWAAVAGDLIDWMHCEQLALVAGDEVQAISSIARPERFFSSLHAAGLYVGDTHVFPDHYSYSNRDIERLSTLVNPVTTTKDAVKLITNWPAEKPLWVLQQQAVAEDGLLDAIWKKLQLAIQVDDKYK